MLICYGPYGDFCEVLTHLYLLLGCSLPVWLECFLVPVVQPNVRPMAGLLLIGIGDSCAALVGTSEQSHGGWMIYNPSGSPSWAHIPWQSLGLIKEGREYRDGI